MGPKMERALHRLEERRVALERDIVRDLEARFFSSPPPVITATVLHLGLAGIAEEETTTCGGAFETTWLADR